jgi:iron complex transport system substrate-binding protein
LKKLALLAFIVIALTSCTKKSTEEMSEFSIADDIGVEIDLKSKPLKIVSMAPNVTEAIYALGGESKLVGVTTLCTYPPDAVSKTKVGDYLSPDYEVITSLQPDLIFLNVENKSNPTYLALENLGFKIYVVNIDNFDGVINMLHKFGVILDKEERASQLTDSLKGVRNLFTEAESGKKKPDTFIIIASNPLMTASGKTFINDIMEMSGLNNIYKSEGMEYPNISFEDVIMKNPEYIILPSDTTDIQSINANLEEIKTSLSTTDAVKNNKILIIDANTLFRPGPRLLDGVNLIRSKL